MDINVIWFLLVGILLTGYAVLDGFDLGVGVLHLFIRNDEYRRVFLNAIGPVWDGNEVWLVTGGGALFAAFPTVYASAFSGFYMAFMLLLAALIFRAVAIEFRSKEPWAWWRNLWDAVFALGSIVSTVLFGIALGNIIAGLPIGEDTYFTQTGLLGLLAPYPVLVGLFVLSLFTLHGAIYLNLKTEGELQDQIRLWVLRGFGFFNVLYMMTTVATIVWYPHMIDNFSRYPWAWVIAGLTMLAIANIPRTMHKGLEYQALFTSGAVISGTFALFGLGLFPDLLPSRLNPDWSLTIYNAASSPQTLHIMLIIALIGMPFVLAYTVSIYWMFRGKVKVDKFSY